MKATIAIPPHNRVNYLDEVFAGALSQRYEDYEILVGDSSSNDEVQEKVRSFGHEERIRYIRYSPSLNQPQKFNEMLKEARGEWVVFLGDDDSMDPDFLPALMAHAENEPRAAIILCRFREIDGQGKLLRLDPTHKEVMSPAEFLSHLFLPSRDFFKMNITGPLFRRDFLLQEGGFSVLPHHWHTDIIGWAKVGSRGLALFEKRPLCSIRVHRDSATSVFDDDMEALIQAAQGLEKIVLGLLTRMESEVTTAEDRELLKIAKQNLHTYAKRHVGRAFDHGFIKLLSQNDPELAEKLSQMSARMREMDIPAFSSAYIYPPMRFFSHPLRRVLLQALTRYKVMKQCSRPPWVV